VEKQPTLRGPLREYVKQSESSASFFLRRRRSLTFRFAPAETGSNKARSTVLLEALGGEDDEAEVAEESRAGTPSEVGAVEGSPAPSSVGGQGMDYAQ
jgi:hypothetical protein